MALGMLIVIVGGNIDLSVGSVMGFVGALAAVMIVHWEMPVLSGGPALPARRHGDRRGAGLLGRLLDDPVLHRDAGGDAGLSRRCRCGCSRGSRSGPSRASFQLLSTGFIPDLLAARQRHRRDHRRQAGQRVRHAGGPRRRRRRSSGPGCASAARNSAYGIEDEPAAFFVARNVIVAGAILFLIYKLSTFRGLPNVLITMGVLTVVYAFLTERTTLGRRIYALGGNRKAAKLSGITTERLTFLTFVNMGFLAALAGLIFAARLNTATPKAGFALELDVIAAVFIGGASMSGGVGKIVGAVVGAFIMGVMNNGMSIMGIGIDYQQVIKGLVLLAAVIFDVYNKQKQG